MVVFPEVGTIHRGSVRKLESYGAFIEIPPFRTNGLCHVSQLSKQRVETSSDVLDLNQEVWVKVIKVEETEVAPGAPKRGKISLSIKYVSQTDGADLDPEGVLAETEERKRSAKPRGEAAAAAVAEGAGVVSNAQCAKCGGRGHLATECFTKSGQNYALLAAADDGPSPERSKNDAVLLAQTSGSGSGKAAAKAERKAAKKAAKAERKATKKAKKKDKKAKKDKKDKKNEAKKRRRVDTSSSSSRSSSRSDSGDERGPQPAPALEPFVPSAQFAGRRAGYVFKNGSSGVGYYLDGLIIDHR